MNRAHIKPYIEKKLVSETRHPDYEWLSIYNYTHKCQIDGAWDDITIQCRGLILNTWDNSVVARPFSKFFNKGEKEHDIPMEAPHVYDKLDGSLGILYWVNDVPFIATRGSFASDQAKWATRYFNDFADFSEYDRTKTYLFEIIYPENRIVVRYDYEGLVLVAVRDTVTGEDNDISKLPDLLNIRRAELMEHTDIEKLAEQEKDNAEGFVVFYPSTGLRIKLKFEEYKRLHRIVTNVTPRSIWDALRHNSDLSEILERVPDEFYNWVAHQRDILMAEYRGMEGAVKYAYDKVKAMDTRKDQALWLRENMPKMMSAVFAKLDDKDYSQIIWRTLKPKKEDVFKKIEQHE